jgi:Family of unknown function (DUF6459)
MPALPPERPRCPKAPGERRPLPDPAAVRLCLVPDSAPPYDDEVPAGEPPGLGWGAMGPARPMAVPATATTRSPAAGGPGAGGPGAGGPGAGGPRAAGLETGRPADGDGSAPDWQSRFAQVLAETLAGSRAPRQIQPWTTQQAREHIQRLGPRMASVQRPRVRRVVTYRPASDVLEMAVVVGFGSRVRALAVRLERSAVSPPASLGEPAGRWVCTAVEAA